MIKGRILLEKYKILNIIQKANNPQIYLGQNILSNELIIIKLEYKQDRRKKGYLEKEYNFLNILKSPGFPIIKQIGYLDYNHLISIQAFLGLSLSEIFENFFRKFNIKDITMISIQILERIKFIHSKNIIHCNINPDNFMIDFINFRNTIYMTNFNSAMKNNNNSIINNKNNNKDDNNNIFSSMNSMIGLNISKKDDLESFIYMIIFFFNGFLPWEYIEYDNNLSIEEKHRKIYQLKKNYNLNNLCENIPEEFKLFFNYIKEINQEQEIDYNYCFNLFYSIFKKNNIINDGIFSWYQEKINKSKIQLKSYYKTAWQKKFLQKKTSMNILFKKKDDSLSQIKRANSCLIKAYKNINDININKADIINKNSILLLSPKNDYSIEGEIDEIKKEFTNKKLNSIKKKIYYKTKENNDLDIFNSSKSKEQLNTEKIMKNKIRMKNDSLSKSEKDMDESSNQNKKYKKKITLNIYDLFFKNNINKPKVIKVVKKNINNKKEISINKIQIKPNKTKKSPLLFNHLDHKFLTIDNINKNIKPLTSPPSADRKKDNSMKMNNKDSYKKVNNHMNININNNLTSRKKNTRIFRSQIGNEIKNRNKLKKINKIKISSNAINKAKPHHSIKNSAIFPKTIKKNEILYSNNNNISFPVIHNTISKLNFIQNISNIFITKSFFDTKNLSDNQENKENKKLKIKSNTYIKPKNYSSKIIKITPEKKCKNINKENVDNLYNYYLNI